MKLSGWNYRVVRKVTITGNDTDVWYGIHEVYYGADGHPEACTEGPVVPVGETLGELEADIAAYVDALRKPAIDYDSIGLLQPQEPVKS